MMVEIYWLYLMCNYIMAVLCFLRRRLLTAPKYHFPSNFAFIQGQNGGLRRSAGVYLLKSNCLGTRTFLP